MTAPTLPATRRHTKSATFTPHSRHNVAHFDTTPSQINPTTGCHPVPTKSATFTPHSRHNVAHFGTTPSPTKYATFTLHSRHNVAHFADSLVGA